MPLASDQQTHIPGTADLDNPLYYLENFETVVRWVRRFHSDLLTADEIGKVDGLLSLDQPARALLARMVMRTGDLFRVEKFNYPEIGVPVNDAVSALATKGWIEDNPSVPLAELFRLFTRWPEAPFRIFGLRSRITRAYALAVPEQDIDTLRLLRQGDGIYMIFGSPTQQFMLDAEGALHLAPKLKRFGQDIRRRR